MQQTVEVGILVSTEGTYRRMGASTLAGLRHAIAEINDDTRRRFRIEHQHYDPAGRLEGYAQGIIQLIDGGARHIFGTTTSASRKEIIPDLERTQSLLWYACPYEGFECSENVLYLGGCPNQNLIPLLGYALGEFGANAYLVGSNYVWGWESNRIARELIELSEGQVLGEKYFRFGCTDFGPLIANILKDEAAFVLNNLVGESSYHFLRQLSDACAFKGVRMPVLSCNFTEAELPCIRGADQIQLLSCGAFFEAVNLAFAVTQRQRHEDLPLSHYYACAYTAMHLYAKACELAGTDDPDRICDLLSQGQHETVLGRLSLSAHNNHFSLPSYIAAVEGDGFEILHKVGGCLSADPYLVKTDLRDYRQPALQKMTASNLRIVK
jgi:ABC-type branched-subunit amino acid transport system substrate-binding protein